MSPSRVEFLLASKLLEQQPFHLLQFFLIGAGSNYDRPKQLKVEHPYERPQTKARHSLQRPFSSTRKAPTASSTSLIRTPNHRHSRSLVVLSLTTLASFQSHLDVVDILSISCTRFWVVVSTQLNGAYDVFAASCDNGTSAKARNLHVEQ